MADRIKTIAIIGLIGLIVFLLVDSCSRNKEMYSQSVVISNYKDTVMSYKDKNGKLVDYNKSIELDLEVAYANVEGLEKEIKDLKLKKPDVVIKYRNQVKIDSVEVALEIPCEEFKKDFTIDSTYYLIKGTLTNTSLLFKDITIPNEQTFVVAKKKDKWYKSSEYVIVAKNSNPYIMSDGLQSYNIKPTKKLYQKWYFHVGVGLLGGLLLDNVVK